MLQDAAYPAAMATIVGFVSQKGGVGKSTLARALAREAAAGALAVKVADLDPQNGTSVSWHRRRLSAGIEPTISVEAYKTAAQAMAVRESYELLVLDGPARASSATLDIAQAADLVVQPSGTSLDDLEPAVLLFHELVREGVPRSKLVIALCRAGTDAEEADARSYVQQAGYTTLPGCLLERPAYRQAQNAGYAVTETKFAGLSKKADQLIQAMIDRMGS